MRPDIGESERELPNLSVIVPIFNAAATLRTTLPSWLHQDYPAEWLLVDDGSTDETPDLLAAMLPSSGNVSVLTHERNRGRAAARNTGIAAATGEVLLFLDADMQPEPDFVRQHAMLHRDAGVIGIVSNPVLEQLAPRDPYHRYLRSRRGAAGVGPGQPLPFKYFIIGYTSVKSHAVGTVGGFDDRLSYGEDLDFAYRLAQHWPNGLRFSERPVVHHYDHGDLDGRLEKLREFGRDNLPILLAKHPDLAAAADIDFVASPALRLSWKAALKQWVLRPRIAASLRRMLPYAPPFVRNTFVRYIFATAVATSFRDAVSP